MPARGSCSEGLKVVAGYPNETFVNQISARCNTCSLTGSHTTPHISRQGEQWVANGTQVGKASHTPFIHKERIIGDREINGTEPPYVWQIGGGSKQTA
jgi:hypothetical protein